MSRSNPLVLETLGPQPVNALKPSRTFNPALQLNERGDPTTKLPMDWLSLRNNWLKFKSLGKFVDRFRGF